MGEFWGRCFCVKRYICAAVIVILEFASIGMTAAAPDLAGIRLEEKIGQLFMVDIRYFQGNAVTTLPEAMSNQLYRLKPGGIILFKENLVNAEQTRKLTADLQLLSSNGPMLIAVDQEGGAIQRVTWGTTLPGNMAIGAADSMGLAFANGQVIGKELQVLGMNVDFAPVLDVNVNPANPVIGVRSFGSDPERVASLGIAWMQGLQSAGVAAAVKHFPGHGDTTVDSHRGLPIVRHDRQRLEAVELKPFREAAAQGADMVMTAHISFPALDGSLWPTAREDVSTTTPATLSRPVLTGILREEWGYQGIVVTDALEMKAIADRIGPVEAALQALQAGADILLMPPEPEAVAAGIARAVLDGRITENRIDESVERILALKQKLAAQRPITTDVGAINSEEHRQVATATARQAATLLRNPLKQLPLRLASGQRIVVLAPTATALTDMLKAVSDLAVSNRCAGVVLQGFAPRETVSFDRTVQQAIASSDYVIVGYRRGGETNKEDSAREALNAEVAAWAKRQQVPLALLLLKNPYDLADWPDTIPGIAVYSAEYPSIDAGMRVIFGMLCPTGKLPVFLPGFGSAGEAYPLGYGLEYSKD
ncbi:MAG TPA: glycoside hydrolase family 3 protein [Patescibacteria group bacterium]|nr:glycoside hydrolase family 3 protein [Patescibacteria group bacterium]